MQSLLNAIQATRSGQPVAVPRGSQRLLWWCGGCSIAMLLGAAVGTAMGTPPQIADATGSDKPRLLEVRYVYATQALPPVSSKSSINASETAPPTYDKDNSGEAGLLPEHSQQWYDQLVQALKNTPDT